jgi:hypothetical protein
MWLSKVRGRSGYFRVCAGVGLPAVVCAGADKLALELGQAAENCQHQPTVRRRGVDACTSQRLHAVTLYPLTVPIGVTVP